MHIDLRSYDMEIRPKSCDENERSLGPRLCSNPDFCAAPAPPPPLPLQRASSAQPPLPPPPPPMQQSESYSQFGRADALAYNQER